MSLCVCMGAKLKCSFGTAPSNFSVIDPTRLKKGESKTIGIITDVIPGGNIAPFGSCSSPSNPAVIAAYGAPQPCTPMTGMISPTWLPGSTTVKINGIGVLNKDSIHTCLWTGVIEVLDPGQQTINLGS